MMKNKSSNLKVSCMHICNQNEIFNKNSFGPKLSRFSSFQKCNTQVKHINKQNIIRVKKMSNA